MTSKIMIRSLILVAVLFVVFIFTKNRLHDKYLIIRGFTQGTTYQVTYERKKGINLQNEIEHLLHDISKSLSTYDSTSNISRINRNDPDVLADDYFLQVYRKAEEINRVSDGLFDITIAPVVNAWGFGFTEKSEVDSSLIDSLLIFVGMDKVWIEDDSIHKKDDRILFDVNAIAQGFSVDLVADFLESKGIRNYLVEIGGEVTAKGKNRKKEIWRIGIDKPIEGNNIPGENLQTIIHLKNRSLATSGNYRKFFEKDGVKYAHSINPKTGYPVLSNLLSATILADDCMTADGYATACMVMGLEKSIQLLKDHKELDGYLIYSNDKGEYEVYSTLEED